MYCTHDHAETQNRCWYSTTSPPAVTSRRAVLADEQCSVSSYAVYSPEYTVIPVYSSIQKRSMVWCSHTVVWIMLAVGAVYWITSWTHPEHTRTPTVQLLLCCLGMSLCSIQQCMLVVGLYHYAPHCVQWYRPTTSTHYCGQYYSSTNH